MNAWLLKIHRWLALIFALPLAVLIVTGLILSFEPMAVTNGIQPESLTTDHLLSFLDKHDPKDEATRISVQHYHGTLTLRGEDRVTINTTTGAVSTSSNWLRKLFRSARGLHEHMIWDLDWLVEPSTYIMLALIALGIFMGLPRFTNTLAGWHQGIAWVLIPLIILSPLTALGVYNRVSLAPAPSKEAKAAKPENLREAIKIIGAKYDLSTLASLRTRRGRLQARLVKNGEYRNYAVTNAGMVALPRNWPRLIHEGNWYGNVSALINIITSLALMLLLATGIYAWVSRSLRLTKRRRTRLAEGT